MCIIFVTFGHINYLLYPKLLLNPLSNASSSFRMPLYFFLSGLFFKIYGGFLDFTLRKTNKLLVLFVFWHLTLSLGLAWAIGIVTTGSWSLELVKENILAILHNGTPLNIPLWFLIALFVTNILFYCLFALAEKLKSIPLTATLAVGAILLGVAGQLLRTFEVYLPLYLDTACTAMPFFAAGYLIRKHTNLLSTPMNWKGGAMIAFGLVMMAIAFIKNVYFMDLRLNAIHVPFLHIFGGMICKLCGNMPDIGKCLITFVVVTSLCLACIPLCLKYLPKFTAQKDLIKTRG